MTLQDNCCTLEQAKTLHGLLPSTETALTWVYHSDRDPFVQPTEDVAGRYYGWGMKDGQQMYPAFTVSELGAMLNVRCDGVLSDWNDTLPIYEWVNKHITPAMKSEAIFRADLLIYLLENKLLTAELVNQRLSLWKVVTLSLDLIT